MLDARVVGGTLGGADDGGGAAGDALYTIEVRGVRSKSRMSRSQRVTREEIGRLFATIYCSFHRRTLAFLDDALEKGAAERSTTTL
jgi:hypothetical protein